MFEKKNTLKHKQNMRRGSHCIAADNDDKVAAYSYISDGMCNREGESEQKKMHKTTVSLVYCLDFYDVVIYA